MANFCELVVDQVVQSDDGANQRGEINDKHLIVGLDVQGVGEVVVADVGQQVEDVLQLVRDLMVDGQLAVADLLQVVLDVAQLEIQSLQAEQLVGDLLRQTSDGRVFDVAQQVLDSNFFSFLCADFAWNVLESFRCRRAVLVDLLDSDVRFGRQPQVLRLGVDDDEDRVGAVTAEQLVNGDVVLVELRTSVIPSDDPLAGVHLLEHPVHRLEIIVIQEPDGLVLFILVERN